MKTDLDQILKQFEPIQAKFNELKARSKYGDLNDLPDHEVTELQAICISCIHRVAGTNSPYAQQAQEALSRHKRFSSGAVVEVYGIVRGLRADAAAGHLSTLRELIHADLFADLLETAQYFLSEGHKDPAAVMIGGVLESHLRQLCLKNNISTENPTPNGGTKPKRAELLNQELATAGVYSKQEQKSVTAWLGLRNSAAHGHYDLYTQEQVDLFLMSVRDFINRFPA